MESISLIGWTIILTLSVVATILSAGAGAPATHMATTGLVGLTCVLLALRERRALETAGASRGTVAATTARYIGLVWVWGALGLFVTYFFILAWRDWWQFVLAFAAVGVLSLLFAAALERDDRAGREDETMLKLGRYLAIGQLAGMVIAVLGLAIDPDKEFLSTKRPDWAANTIFLFGALALAAITAHALIHDRSRRRRRDQG
jgi:hypothetical protein